MILFSDPDPLEHDMGVMCRDMSADQLVAYILAYQAAFGITLTVEGFRERSVFLAMQRLYGRADAGDIVKWVFYRYHGRYRGELIGHLSFTKGQKWFVDKMHREMQDFRAGESLQTQTGVGGGLGVTSLMDF